MDTICLDDIKALIQMDGGAHVSIFMPAHHKGGEDQQDPIRLRNLLRLAEEKLAAKGLRSAEARAMLKPAERLLTDNLFWRQQSDGLALFIRPDMYLYYRVPIVLREEVGVAERFYIKPLVSLLSDCGLFYILAISHDEVRLLQCTAFGSVRIKLEGIPRSMTEALRYETPDNRVQYRVPAPAGGSNFGGGTAIQAGAESRPNYHKRDIMQYLEQISKGIGSIMKTEKAPMVLAAVDYIHPMYQTANIYNGLLKEGILGNPDGLSDDALREQAWSVVRPYFEHDKREAVAEFQKSAGTGLTATGVEAVLVAAFHGRIRFLFLAEGVQQWGRFDSDNDQVTIHSEAQAEDSDLIDLAAFQTLRHAGTIFVLKPGEIPGDAPVSAILRY